MKTYLEKKLNQKLGITRAGIPKEVYFEATLLAVEDEHALFQDQDGKEFALAIDKIVIAGAPEGPDDETRAKPGFV